jgi:hypothetical protein
MFMIRLCSDHAAYEAVPRRRLSLDMVALKQRIEEGSGWEVATHTPQFLVIKRDDGVEVTIVDDGRMIIRNVADQKSAGEIAEAILPSSTRAE